MHTNATNYWQEANEREAQAAYGRAQTMQEQQEIGERFSGRGRRNFDGNSVTQRNPQFGINRSNGAQHSTPTLRGHMAFLLGLQESGAKVRFVLINDEAYVGQIKAFDEQTVSVRIPKPTETNPSAYQNIVLFKRNLISFTPIVEGVVIS